MTVDLDVVVDPYRELVLNAPDAILIIALGKVKFANPAAALFVGGTDPRELLDTDVLAFIHPASRAKVMQVIQMNMRERRAESNLEVKLQRLDGTLCDVEVMTCPTTYQGAGASIVFVRDLTSRKAAERELRASEERYRQVVESMNEGLVVYDAHARVAYANQQLCTMFDCKAEDIIGKPVSELYDDVTTQLVYRGIARRRLGLHDQYEAQLTSRNGKRVYAQISAAPLQDDGEFAGSLAVVNDITEKHDAEEKLRKSELRYQELVDSSPNYIYSFDCHDRYTAVNKAACERLGLPKSEILGRTLEEVGVPPDAAEQWRRQSAETRKTGRTQVRESVVSFQGNDLRTLRRITSPVYAEDGSLIGVSGFSIDITEQKASEQKHQTVLRAIEEMDEVMFTTDPDGIITYVNPAFERVYGYRRDEAIGQTPRIIRSSETPSEVYEGFWRELRKMNTVQTEFVNRRKDGQLLRIVASVSPIHDDDGRLTGYTAVQRDVTAQRHADEEKRLMEAGMARAAKMQALGTLAGGIAHDFNNILSIVLTHATLAELSAENPTRMTQALGTIKQAVTRGAALSRQILTFARQTNVRSQSVQADRVVQEIGSMIREMFPRNIEIDVRLDRDIPQITGDADQVHQAILNLCLNARDAMGSGGILTLDVQRIDQQAILTAFPGAVHRHHVCIAVSDTGHGMSPETASRIFEPFFTTKDIGKGSGLGLAVVYGIVKAHEGQIDVLSEVGRGTTLRLYFPAQENATCEQAGVVEECRKSGSERLLLIEDEIEIAKALAMQLVEFGYAVTTAHNPEQAVTALNAGAFDVIISDLGIPGSSSRDLVQLLRKTAPDLPLIPMTGYVDPDLHRDVVSAGARPVLEKPFTLDDLLRRIRDAVA